MPLTNLVREQILDEDAIADAHDGRHAVLPRRGGRGGQDTRGMIRMHQFDKVEIVSITDAGAIARKNMSA